ncbi:ABC transporter substrate-binding protein [Streptomyces ovatisporus]|uniref:ABC transporter substrate-binding protein n=1 Tax=Streptomyces ovatisporus TaxID=1128682 RepID=A0ABV9A476_9ACTN
MKLRVHPKEWGPLQRAAAVVAAAAVVGLGAWLVNFLWPGPCGDDLEEVGGECVGVTDKAFPVADAGVQKLVEAIEKENHSGAKTRLHVRVALTMPFTYADRRSADNTSTLTKEMIRHALAGTLVEQKRFNKQQRRLWLQVLPAPVGKNLDKWPPVHDQIEAMTDDKAPVVGVTGVPSSTRTTQEAVKDLSARGIPTFGPLVSSTDMTAEVDGRDHLFKTSPSNEEFVHALRKYLDLHPQGSDASKDERGILVYDREEDAYAQDLKDEMEEEFDKDWGVRGTSVEYSGITSRSKGQPRDFDDATEDICGGKIDTIFFAGRDQDLPRLISEIEEGRCEKKPRRILKVGTGFDPSLTSPDNLDDMDKANITLVDASSVDTGWWNRERGIPDGVDNFRDEFEAEFQGESGKWKKSYGLGTKPLDDGYAAMSHDGLRALADAVEDSYNENLKHSKKTLRFHEVYNNLRNSAYNADRCAYEDCLEGAGGTYGLGRSDRKQWSVCKPVPVLELDAHKQVKPKRSDGPLYRTYQDKIKEDCPSD